MLWSGDNWYYRIKESALSLVTERVCSEKDRIHQSWRKFSWNHRKTTKPDGFFLFSQQKVCPSPHAISNEHKNQWNPLHSETAFYILKYSTFSSFCFSLHWTVSAYSVFPPRSCCVDLHLFLLLSSRFFQQVHMSFKHDTWGFTWASPRGQRTASCILSTLNILLWFLFALVLMWGKRSKCFCK